MCAFFCIFFYSGFKKDIFFLKRRWVVGKVFFEDDGEEMIMMKEGKERG